MNIRPLYDRVVIKRHISESKSSSGILLSGTAIEKSVTGTVVAIGSGRVLENGTSVPMEVKVGDVVLFGSFIERIEKVDDQEYVITKEDNILGVILN